MRSFTTHSLPSHNKKDRSTYGLALRSFLSGGEEIIIGGKRKLLCTAPVFTGFCFVYV